MTTTTRPTGATRAASGRSDTSTPVPWGQLVSFVAAGAQIMSIFLTWTAAGATALTIGLPGTGAGGQPTVATVLVVLAALPAVAALIGDAGWPRGVSGLATGALVLVWLGFGPDGQLTPGVLTALGAGIGHLGAAAVATGTRRDAGEPSAPASPREDTDGRAGHRLVDHTADVIIEAWGPTRAACFAEALRGLVGSFTETAGVAPTRSYETSLDADDDEDLLVDLLDEVIYLLDARNVVPVGGNLTDRDSGGLDVRLELASAGDVRPAGAVPKATTYHQLDVTHTDAGWHCRATIDV